MDVNRLKQLVSDNGEDFKIFKDMLLERNKICNLTSVCDDEGIYFKHFLDSVAGEEYFFKGAKVAEIGSGGGFPSIPLKIVRRDLKFTLIESTGKKCAFLKDVVDKLGLDGMNILNIRAEDGARLANLREKFDVCCARAVAALNTLSEYCLPYVKPGGRFIAYKGDCGGELEKAGRAVKILGGEIEKTDRFGLENCGIRTIVVIKKVGATPALYPRGRGKEKKQPL